MKIFGLTYSCQRYLGNVALCSSLCGSQKYGRAISQHYHLLPRRCGILCCHLHHGNSQSLVTGMFPGPNPSSAHFPFHYTEAQWSVSLGLIITVNKPCKRIRSIYQEPVNYQHWNWKRTASFTLHLALSRLFNPKRLTKSTFVRRKRNNISLLVD